MFTINFKKLFILGSCSFFSLNAFCSKNEKHDHSHKHDHSSTHSSKHSAQSGAPHEHGKGEVHFVLDNDYKSGEIDFHLPALDLIGYERTPKSEEEKTKLKQILENLKTAISHSFVFAPNKKCQVKFEDMPELEIEGSHAEIHTEVDFKCEKSLENTSIEFLFSGPINSFKSVHVQVISKNSQTSKDIKQPGGKIEVK